MFISYVNRLPLLIQHFRSLYAHQDWYQIQAIHQFSLFALWKKSNHVNISKNISSGRYATPHTIKTKPDVAYLKFKSQVNLKINKPIFLLWFKSIFSFAIKKWNDAIQMYISQNKLIHAYHIIWTFHIIMCGHLNTMKTRILLPHPLEITLLCMYIPNTWVRILLPFNLNGPQFSFILHSVVTVKSNEIDIVYFRSKSKNCWNPIAKKFILNFRDKITVGNGNHVWGCSLKVHISETNVLLDKTVDEL